MNTSYNNTIHAGSICVDSTPDERLSVIVNGIFAHDSHITDMIRDNMLKYISNTIFPELYLKLWDNQLYCTISFERVLIKAIVLTHNNIVGPEYKIPLKDGENIFDHNWRQSILAEFKSIYPDFEAHFDQEIEDIKGDYWFQLCTD